MADTKLAQTDPKAAFWKEVGKLRAGMLGIEGSGQHMQPMSHHCDETGGRIWFLTKRSTDLFKAVGPTSKAHFCIISPDQDFHACASGPVADEMDRAKLDEMWNPVVGAWFEGKDDPDLVMLSVRLQSAAIWASTGSAARFAYEIAKANVTDHDPDVGVHNVATFD
ncbi:pyridoxamine 5'-phosphate oxidase family protein [Cereibacter azotoformans]|uniref:General stress protein 26 n=1 Tax=Cereibacter azotoformans TaxID=43057 RepID=A0A2T5KBB4_9RHOB|nr:pyridoxamine 5'-phosphate oxidase family protein [Cereibacter azotoformans]AXQ93805.1 general stress protein [Cereibacter sphaeroides]MBO4168393.1 pyridoxamine 5'-phosphate oxidase family protein [Cereibacter azotoformans]PTR19708.1 general stress protein 26 [Cereibacter azotoformans]UIJ29319.1 pyridoxamine 5'-phosphate oxidase family protein [Cereibacter azotoformans]